MALSAALVGLLLQSPLYKWLLVPQARRTMVSTAENNGIDWSGASAWIKGAEDWTAAISAVEAPSAPAYFRAPFHAYPEGNLCWEAAFEQELAGKAVGLRNFPVREGGLEGERRFRGSFDTALHGTGVAIPAGATIVDLGCGTGTSTRRLAAMFPEAEHIIGIDLSPHMVAVGRRLLEGVGGREVEEWIEPVQPDPRVRLLAADAAHTGLADSSADLVSLCLVLHELPGEAAREVCREAYRLLRPGGILWLVEMDGTSPGYRDLRRNPALFALIRATEPHLDSYFAAQEELLSPGLWELGFEGATVSAATGRHFSVVARRPAAGGPPAGEALIDFRIGEDGQYAKAETHLHTMDTDGRKL